MPRNNNYGPPQRGSIFPIAPLSGKLVYANVYVSLGPNFCQKMLCFPLLAAEATKSIGSEQIAKRAMKSSHNGVMPNHGLSKKRAPFP